MEPRPKHIVQTTRQAKKEFKKYGPRPSEAQLRQEQRNAELEERAARVRAQEERMRLAKKKREEKERKEREARRQLGVGLATQLIGNNHTQAFLKNRMEAFLGLKKREADEKARQAQVKKKLDDIAEALEKEPWDDGELDNLDMDDLPGLEVPDADSLIDDDLDDSALLEAHNLMKPDSCPRISEIPARSPAPRPARDSEIGDVENDIEYTQLHGPINRALERAIEQLPGPTIELLSKDCSLNESDWTPPDSLLHKLSPVGLPPHRLRIKVGCVVTLMRDVDSGISLIPKSSHLKILRIESPIVECLILDGELKGTKTILRRLPFQGKYRNESHFPFQRIQFPVRVCLDFKPSKPPKDKQQCEFKVPSVPSRPRPGAQTSRPAQKPSTGPNIVPKKAITNAVPRSQMPSKTASKLTEPTLAQKPTTPAPFDILDDWTRFFESGTQIARELHLDGSSGHSKHEEPCLAPILEDDPGFALDVLDELIQTRPSAPIPTSLSRRHTVSTSTIQRPTPKPDAPPRPTSSGSNNLHQTHNLSASKKQLKRKADVNLQPPISKKHAPAPVLLARPPHYGKDPSFPVSLPKKKPAIVPSKPNISLSLNEFVLSTQEAALFDDDDELLLPP
jgi:hypothetical protein